jgi:hypothetical protein
MKESLLEKLGENTHTHYMCIYIVEALLEQSKREKKKLEKSPFCQKKLQKTPPKAERFKLTCMKD